LLFENEFEYGLEIKEKENKRELEKKSFQKFAKVQFWKLLKSSHAEKYI